MSIYTDIIDKYLKEATGDYGVVKRMNERRMTTHELIEKLKHYDAPIQLLKAIRAEIVAAEQPIDLKDGDSGTLNLKTGEVTVNPRER